MYDLNFSFPFTKVDQSRRTVTGVATADNIDPSGDIVDFDASMEAFSDWMGNIREMHQPKSVGKAVEYKPVKVPYQGHIYDGFEVTAYISKGAEDTWEKVLDGTLRGFSIGGKTINKAIGYDKNTNRRGQRVTKYFLGELSLVDNPGNPAALFSLIKRAEDGQTEFCLEKYDVYFCGNDQTASIEKDECPSCHKPMINIGEVEQPETDIVRKFVADYINNCTSGFVSDDLIKVVGDDKVTELLNNNEGDNVSDMDLTPEQQESLVKRMVHNIFGKKEEASLEAISTPVVVNVNVGEEISKAAKSKSDKKTAAADAEDAKDGGVDEDEEDANGKKKIKKGSNMSDDAETTKVEGEEVLEKSTKVETEEKPEAKDDSSDILKGIEALLDSKLTSFKEEITASVDEKIEKVQSSVTEATEKIEKVENSGAIKKSVDANEEDNDKLEKNARPESFWAGAFVPFEIVDHLGYES